MTDDALARALAEREEWAQALFETERINAELAIERQALADALATLESRVGAAAEQRVAAALQERDRAVAARETMRRERDAARQDRDRAEAARQAAQARLTQVTDSTSWRMTAPLRHALALLLRRRTR